MDVKSGKDRRRYERHAVKDPVFLTVRPQFDRLGRLTDIGKEGAAFEYIVHDECNPIDTVEVDIFSSDQDFHLSRLPCKVAYDIDVGHPSIVGIETRRCGLRFRDLSDQQTSQLTTLLRHCSEGCAEDN